MSSTDPSEVRACPPEAARQAGAGSTDQNFVLIDMECLPIAIMLKSEETKSNKAPRTFIRCPCPHIATILTTAN